MVDKETRKKMVPYLLIAPVIIYYFIFWIFPVIREMCYEISYFHFTS